MLLYKVFIYFASPRGQISRPFVKRVLKTDMTEKCVFGNLTDAPEDNKMKIIYQDIYTSNSNKEVFRKIKQAQIGLPIASALTFNRTLKDQRSKRQ
jgi:hypothetical protein